MNVAVLSDGGWGTALAVVLCRNGHSVTLWGPFPDYVDEMRRTRTNPRYLPGIPLPERLRLSDSLAEATAGAGLLVLAAPSQYMRSLLQGLAQVDVASNTIHVNVAKGIEIGSLKRMSELVAELLGDVPYAVLSGPSHAEEVARGVPTAVVAAAQDEAVASTVQTLFMDEAFRVYTAADVLGVELGGSLKNVLALAAGVCDGMGAGDNTKAALLTRGIAELARLGQNLGGSAETFSGLSGIGDVIVTCMSRHSRNRHVGEELGKGRGLQQILDDMGGQVAEGVATCESAFRLAHRAHVETPIIDQVHAALYEGRDPREAVRELMTRDPKRETFG